MLTGYAASIHNYYPGLRWDVTFFVYYVHEELYCYIWHHASKTVTISNATTETVQSHAYELQYIDCPRLRGPRHSSVLEYARAVGAGGGGVGAGVVVALPSPLGPAAAAQLTRSGSLGLSNFRG